MRFVKIYKATAFYCEFASVHLPFIPQAAKSGRETSLGDNSGSSNQEQPRRKMRKGDSTGSQEQPRREMRKGDKLGDKAAAAAKSSPEGKSGRETSLEDKAAAATKSSPGMEIMMGDKLGRRQLRAAQNGNHEGRRAWETRWQRHHDHLAISGISNPVIEK